MTNHLAESRSLYLQKHAENPIDWWYWCDEALSIAAAENKPIFLSIGYSSCHWCTVMEGEAFSDNAIADYLNNNFVPIKVDREERPDIDSIYMQALQMMTGQGGWPLNIFLTPGDLVPFYGGTYFPVTPRYNRPSFIDILKSVRRFYDVETEKLEGFKTEILFNLQRSTSLETTEDALTSELLDQGLETNTAVLSSGDPGRPNFPMIPYATAALQGSRLNFNNRYDADKLCLQRGQDLVLGGICDHVAGGFHRYTVDHTWTVPHFEKMLYDNGQILEYLANLWSCQRHFLTIEDAIAGIVNWLKREMLAPQGYFYASQDADNFATAEAAEPEEGLFYVWSYNELENLLSAEELAELQAEFSITPQGNFEGSNVLQRFNHEELSPSLEQTLQKLFAARYGEKQTGIDTFPVAKNNREAKTKPWPGRIPPVTDTKMITAWNSLIISGLARAASVLGITNYQQLAENTANFILQQQWLEGRLHRLNYDGQATVLAQSEDYALFIKALLDLHQSSPQNPQWLDSAIALQAEFDRLFWSEMGGGYYNNGSDVGDNLLIRERSYMDNATPAANGVAMANLVRLFLLTDNLEYRDRAEQGLQAFAGIMKSSPQACPSLFVALDWLLNGTVVKTTTEEFAILITDYFPTTVYRIVTELPQDAIALVCQGLSCLEPAENLEQLRLQIRQIAE
ncbi:thioredoxin domain containing protein [Xenococcus sp. PCC 7305]|uniref:thioredoxin domain-containing protein n=1 Tax=Xenococcus sp. PCC 7305 TaxID=102125 RepID=UPI0002AC41D6|nr:thioredoxin domain-containing protein [Xenococcus sp. PCC 7305]ELS01887.1 thioredoxin domain containing protein [Xenococcus sp. PCC 7305]